MKDPEVIDFAARFTYHVSLIIVLSAIGFLLMQCST